VLSVQRYRVTVNPFLVLVSSKPTWQGTVAIICGVWIVAALFALPSTVSSYLCDKSFTASPNGYYQRVVIFELLASCVLPLCVIAFSYILTARHLVESSRSISEGTQNSQMKTRRNGAKIVVGLTVVFLISYGPYHVFWTYIIRKQNTYMYSFSVDLLISRSKYATQYLISTCFLLINSCLNPVALFCTSSPFRQHLKRYITCFCKTNFPSTDLELTRRNLVLIIFYIFFNYNWAIYSIYSFSSLSYDRSKASSKASSTHSAIQSFLFQMRLSFPFLKVIQ